MVGHPTQDGESQRVQGLESRAHTAVASHRLPVSPSPCLALSLSPPLNITPHPYHPLPFNVVGIELARRRCIWAASTHRPAVAVAMLGKCPDHSVLAALAPRGTRSAAADVEPSPAPFAGRSNLAADSCSQEEESAPADR
jgi:hypothetical protein